MTFFVDANVFVYAVTAGPRREPAIEVLEAVATGEAQGTTSVAVLEEVWRLELSGRVPDLAGQTRRARSVLPEVLAVTSETLDLALGLDAPEQLGANDRLHVASCREHEIATIVSADRGFAASSAFATGRITGRYAHQERRKYSKPSTGGILRDSAA